MGSRRPLPPIASVAVATLAAVGWSLAAAVPAEARPPGRRGPPGAFLEELSEELALDASTRARIAEVIEASHAEAEALHERHRAARARMRELLSAGLPDEKTVMEQAERLGEIETAKHKHRLATILRIRKLLTPEQRAELQRLRGERMPRHAFGAVMDACEDEVEALCADAEGPFGVGRCLHERRTEVSAACGEALDGLAEHRHHAPRRFGAGAPGDD